MSFGSIPMPCSINRARFLHVDGISVRDSIECEAERTRLLFLSLLQGVADFAPIAAVDVFLVENEILGGFSREDALSKRPKHLRWMSDR